MLPPPLASDRPAACSAADAADGAAGRRTGNGTARPVAAAMTLVTLLVALALLAGGQAQAQTQPESRSPPRSAAQAVPLPGAPATPLAVPLPGTPAAPLAVPATPDGQAELTFIAGLYRAGDDYRAESEALRFLYAHPRHSQRPAVELARAKLYYRAGRYREANLMLYSLLDRYPADEVARDARRLLTFSQLRLDAPDRAAETADALAAPGGGGDTVPSLAELRDLAGPPPDGVDADAAERWSTWLPGTGFLVAREPGKAAVGVTLNLALLGAVVASARDDNTPAALLFLMLEGLLWQGGRSGARQDAEALNQRLRERRSTDWLARHGEPELLGVGLTVHFGGG